MDQQLTNASTQEVKPAEMDLGDWILTVFISFLPVIGLIMLLVWSFSSQVNPNKQNWARATLIIYLFLTILYFVFMLLLFGPIVPSDAFT